MIHVKIAPTHPIRVSHGAEHGMGLPLEIPGAAREAREQSLQLKPISFKI